MSKANAMLDILERECGEAKEQLLADICDLCHRPQMILMNKRGRT